MIGELGFSYEGYESEVTLSNNWWPNTVENAIGYVFDYNAQVNVPMENELEGSYQKQALVEGFKTYTHKVYNTDPSWDFNTIWSNVYEGKGYPVLGFQTILAPDRPVSSKTPGTYASPFNISLTSVGASSIRYTLNGGMPTCATGVLYTSPISISSSTIVKAVGCDSNGMASVLGEFSYVLLTNSTVRNTTTQSTTEESSTSEEIVTPTNEVAETPDNTQTVGKDTEEKDVEQKKDYSWIWWVLLVIAILGGGYIWVKNRKKKN